MHTEPQAVKPGTDIFDLGPADKSVEHVLAFDVKKQLNDEHAF